jgi:hypothetical protein
MTNYSKWNQALISYFTTGMPQGSQIYLSVDDDVLESIGQNFLSPEIGGNSCADFCAAVKKEVIVDGQVKLSHLQGLNEQGLPKSVAFLGAMVLAAYRMAEDEEVNQSNFFRRFKEILDLPISEYSRPRGMKSGAEEPLWQDWAFWLRQKGFIPSAQPGDGSRIYINYPISQTLLRQSDKDQLCKLFHEKQWKTQWDEQTLIVRIRQETTRFSQHLQELFTSYQFKSRYEAISEAIHEVYEQWHSAGCPITLKAALTPSRHIFAGLYRTEDVFSGTIEYFIYPKQPRKRQLKQIEIQHKDGIDNLIEERPGWYEPMEWAISKDEIEKGVKYLIHASEELDDLILPQRDFWILVSEPTNPESVDYASWGAPQLGKTFVLLCQQELLSQLEFLQSEHLLKWNRQLHPFGENSNWIELHECMVTSPAWEGVFIKNQVLKYALQPNDQLSVNFSGGLRVPNLGAWLVDHAPQVTIFGFYPTVELKVTRLLRLLGNALISKERQKTNIPISLNFSTPGEYIIEATHAGESSERLIQIVDWDKLSMTTPQNREMLSIGDKQICGSIIGKKTDHVSDESVIKVKPLDKSIKELKNTDHSSDKPVGKTKPLKKSSKKQQLSLF